MLVIYNINRIPMHAILSRSNASNLYIHIL